MNIKDYLVQHEYVEDIIKAIEKDIPQNKEIIVFMAQYPNIFGEEEDNLSPFNFLMDYEFIKYCEKKYPEIRWGHEIIERYWVSEVN